MPIRGGLNESNCIDSEGGGINMNMINFAGFVSIGVGSLLMGWTTAKCVNDNKLNFVCGLVSNLLTICGTAMVVGG